MLLKCTIRLATPSDVDVIVDYNARLAMESEGRALETGRLAAGVRTVLEGRAEAFYLLAESGNRVVGQLMLTREWSDWRNGWFYWIQSVYVPLDARRQGVFRQLYQAAVDRLQGDPDSVGLRLYVESHNRHAIATYQALGMQAAGYEVLEHPWRNTLPPIQPPTN